MAELQKTPIAIIGVAGIFAQSDAARIFWNNILDKVDCITEVPPSRWNVADYYDPDPKAPDKVYCKRGGFIPDIEFDPLEFGIPPNQLDVTDTSQLLSLVVARELFKDAGYGEEYGGRPFDRQRTGVVLGVAGGQKLIVPLSSRLQYPVWERVLSHYGLPPEQVEEIVEAIKLAYVEWNENAFPGLLGNVIAGRIANRFDLGGMNCVIDAACASSLAALKTAVRELQAGQADMMIAGGVDTDNSPFNFMCFSKTPAFSRGDAPRPFDEAADGMMVGEGIGMLLLKRLSDAERDGDRIYAVILGIGASSDGRFKSIYAPRPEGQALALKRAYEDAGVSPLSIGLLEAHGTGTKAGDPAEFAGLLEVFGCQNGQGQHIALGSVKSQIGHTKAAAGVAGLIKAALALDQRVLPPTINVTRPSPKLGIERSPFYLNTEARPWVKPVGGPPRRAGVSAFGFGGTNFHVVLEEYPAEHTGPYRLRRVAQPLLLWAASPQALIEACDRALTDLSQGGNAVFHRLTDASRAPEIPLDAARLGFVCDSVSEAQAMLEAARRTLRSKPEAVAWDHPKGIFYRRHGIEPDGRMVVLFPGQGAQYLNMGRELVMNFPPLQDLFGQLDALFIEEGLQPLSSVVYPPPAFDDETLRAQQLALQATDYAQASIGALSAGIFRLLAQAGLRPDFTAGHSFGELSALWAGGMLSDGDFVRLVKARGRAMRPPADRDFDAGGMVAVQGPLQEVEAVLEAFDQVVIANQNSNTQVVLAGPTDEMERVAHELQARGYRATILPVSAAFHTPLVGHASEPFAQAVEAVTFLPARARVFSNTTGAPYPADPGEAKALLANHILNPVLFKRQIEAIHEAGGRIFVECGPRRITTGLVEDILAPLAEQGSVAVIPTNASRKISSDRQFREAVVRLRVTGLNLGEVDPYEVR